MNRNRVLLLSLTFTLAPLTLAHPASKNRREAVATRIKATEAPRLDGLPTEPIWDQAQSIGELIQVEPREGETPSEKTDIRILFTSDSLYIALRCFDSDPDGIIGTQMRRDAVLDPDDRVEIILDTFHDRRNGYFFQIGPGGSRGDALIENNGNFNKQWDGIWYGRSAITKKGWFAELRIPFQSLAFDPASSVWGFNVNRYIRRRNEVARWEGARQSLGIFRIAEAGNLRGFSELQQGLGLDIQPYFKSKYERDVSIPDRDLELRGGGEAYYRITPALTGALTYRTDFAETEVDNRQINLTRFPLFFPEKRDFFLQDAGIFGVENAGSGIRPFFSRRIGLDGSGNPIPILAGAKITGRFEGHNIGILDVQTEEKGENPSRNLFAGRVSHNVFEQSRVGFIATRGNPTGVGSNALVGGDFSYRTSSFLGENNLNWNSFFLGTDTSGVNGNSLAYGSSVNASDNVWSVGAGSYVIQPDFNPALGFTSRRGIRSYNSWINYSPRPQNWIRNYEFSVDGFLTTDTTGQMESAGVEVQPFGISLESDDAFRVEYEREWELLEEDFEISDGIIIPTDRYAYDLYRLELATGEQRPVNGELSYQWGEFFDGDRTRWSGEIAWRPAALFNAEFEYSQNRIELEDGDFTTRILQLQTEVNFSPDLSWNNLAQFDNQSDKIGLNSRLRWIMADGEEMFLVFNQNWNRDKSVITPEENEVTLKLVYTIRF